MKRLFTCLFLLVAYVLQAQVLNIPDADFKAVLLSANTTNGIALDNSDDAIILDANGDGQIQQSEADEVRTLNIDNAGILSLYGIGGFTNLRYLNVSGNQLTAFDATVLPELRSLDCSGNSLTSLTLGGLDNLQELIFNDNQISTINFSGLEYLEFVDCSDNNLTELNFSACLYLNSFNCSNNQITSINIKNGYTQSAAYATVNEWEGNPLQYICTDDNEITNVNNLLTQNGYSNVSVNTYCSITPGGYYNNITGAVIFDLDNNGCDMQDTPHCFIKLKLNDGTADSYTFTNEWGMYNFYRGAGNFTVQPDFEHPEYYTATPASGTIQFNNNYDNIATENFCVAATAAASDLEVVMVPVNKGVPGQNVEYKIVYKNKGNTTISGSVSCQWDYDTFSDFVSVDPMPADVQPDLYVWDFTDLQPFESREIDMTLTLNNGSQTPPVYAGDTVPFTAQVSVPGDSTPADNSFVFSQKIAATALDNFVECVEGESQPMSAVGEYLHYVVNYTNTGTDTADNVVITQNLDPAVFDISTLEVLNSTHAMVARVANNTAEFIMNGASVVEGDGHGSLIFKVKTKLNLQLNTTAVLQPSVFFTYNNPIAANGASTTFGTLGTGNFERDNSVQLTPNPAVSNVIIKAQSLIKEVVLYDIQGRQLQVVMANDTEVNIDLTSRAEGVYLVKVVTEKGAAVQKVIKQ